MTPRSSRAWVVSLTPFDQKGGLDESAFRAHLRRMREAGICVYVGSSNAGEGFTLTSEERQRVFVIAAEELKGIVQVRAAGCEPQSIAEAVAYLRAAESAELDAAHVFPLDTGHAGVPTPAEIERFYTDVISSTRLPVVLSNYPGMGYTLSLSLLARLLERFPQIIAVRDAGADTGYLRGLVSLCAGRAEVYTGGIKNLITAMYHGSQGFLSSEANLAPELAVMVLKAFDAGDFAALNTQYQNLYRLHDLVNRFGGSAGRGMKPLLNLLGLPGGTLRPPRIALGGTELAEMHKAYQALNLPGAPMSTSCRAKTDERKS